jgi:hypothetical protein
MNELFSSRLTRISYKFDTFGKSVVRFGLPWVILYRGIDYLSFRMTLGKAGLPYPWRMVLAMDLPIMLVVSAVWWGLMREISIWKRKNQHD